MNIAMVAGWNGKRYVGDEADIEDALGGIASEVLGVYTSGRLLLAVRELVPQPA